MAWATCPSCKEYDWLSRHTCNPKFLVWCEEDHGETEEDAQTIRALNHVRAAERWAEETDCNGADYLIVGGKSEPVVCVRKVGDARVLRFRVSGETVPSYTARELEDKKGEKASP